MSHTIIGLDARLSSSTENSDLSILIVEAAEAKLYYLRDTLTPAEFDIAVQEELDLALRNANEHDPPLKVLVRKVIDKVVAKFAGKVRKH